MKNKQVTPILCILIVLLTISVSAQEEEIIFNLNHPTKIPIYDVHTFNSPCYIECIDYLKIQKEASNIKFNNSLGLNVSYKRYSTKEINNLLKDIAYCCMDYQTKQAMLPDEIYDTITINFPKEVKEYPNITLYLEYNIPQETKTIQIFRNHLSLSVDKTRKISFILPKNTKLWYYSASPDEFQELNDTLMIKWKDLSNETLLITYGSTTEYLFYENKKDSLLNDFMMITILLFTIMLSFSIYLKQNRKYNELINSLFKLYIYIFTILIPLFLFLAKKQDLILPFYNQYFWGLLIRALIMFIILLITFLFIKKTKLLKIL